MHIDSLIKRARLSALLRPLTEQGFHLIETLAIVLIASLCLGALIKLVNFELHQLTSQQTGLRQIFRLYSWSSADFAGPVCVPSKLESGKVVIDCTKQDGKGRESTLTFLVD
jgi:hypothetical protein